MKKNVHLKHTLMIMSAILTTFPSHAEIITANTIKSVQTQVEIILKTYQPKDVLVAFDIDMTLTQPDHPAVYYPSLKKYGDISKKIMGSLTPEQKDFASTLTTQLVPFSHFKKYAGAYPMFYKGILSTNGEGDASKGDVLVAFLRMQELSYEPHVVVLIDDKKKHLDTVKTSLKAYNPSIHFLGIEYQGAFVYAPQEISRKEFQAFWKAMASQAKLETFD